MKSEELEKIKEQYDFIKARYLKAKAREYTPEKLKAKIKRLEKRMLLAEIKYYRDPSYTNRMNMNTIKMKYINARGDYRKWCEYKGLKMEEE